MRIEKTRADFRAIENGVDQFKRILLEGQEFTERIDALFSNPSSSLQNEYTNIEKLKQELQQLEQLSNLLQQNATSLSSYLRTAIVQMNKRAPKDNNSFTVLKESEATEIFTSLIKDEFETNVEHISRVRSAVERLGSFQIGKVQIKKENYDINSQMIQLDTDSFMNNIIYEEWVGIVSLRRVKLFPGRRDINIFKGLPEYLKIIGVDCNTAKVLYENQSEDGYSLVMKIAIDTGNQILTVNEIRLITGWKTFDVQITDILNR